MGVPHMLWVLYENQKLSLCPSLVDQSVLKCLREQLICKLNIPGKINLCLNCFSFCDKGVSSFQRQQAIHGYFLHALQGWAWLLLPWNQP